MTTIKRYEWRGYEEGRKGDREVSPGECVSVERDAAMRMTRFLLVAPHRSGDQEYDLPDLQHPFPHHVYADSPSHLAETLRLPEWVSSYLYEETGTYSLGLSKEEAIRRINEDINAGRMTIGAVTAPMATKYALESINEWSAEVADEVAADAEQEEQPTSFQTIMDSSGMRHYVDGKEVSPQECEQAHRMVYPDRYAEREPDAMEYALLKYEMEQITETDLQRVLQQVACPECTATRGHYASCTRHPESGQESATAKADPATPSLRVHMRGDVPDDGEVL